MPRSVSVRVWMGIVFVLFTASFLAVSPVSSAPAASYAKTLRRYPYLTDAVGSSATINWATDRSRSSGGVRYGKKSTEACTAHYVAATKTAITVNGVSEYQWKAPLSLQTGTQYCYRVYLGTSSTGETDLLGSDASPAFRTQLSSSATQPYSFVVLGDWGEVNSAGTNPAQAKLMSLIASSGARFVVTTGDNAYPGGNQANYGDLVQKGANLSTIFGPSFWKVPGSSLPIFLAQGNHGLSSNDAVHPALVNWPEARAVSTSNGRYKTETYCCLDGTSSNSYPSMWYAFNAGQARFYVLHAAWSEANLGTASTPYKVDYDYHWAPGTAQYKWLQADLAAHASQLKFAFLHYPLYSDSPTQPSDTFLRGSNSAEGLFKQYGVNLVFTGHAHIYQRNRAGTSGVINYVTGGGGATLSTLGACSLLDAYALGFTSQGKACGSAPVPGSAAKVYHFLKVAVDGRDVTVTPINSLGETFDVQHYSFAAGAQNFAPMRLPQETEPAGPSATPTAGTPTGTPSPTITPSLTATPPCSPTPTAVPTGTGTPGITPTATNTETPTATPTVPPTSTGSPAVTPTASGTATPACIPTPTISSTPGTATPGTATPTATPSPTGTTSPAPTPVVTVVSGPGLTFTTEADAQVSEAAPAVNFGTSTELASNGAPGNRKITFVRFTIRGMRDTIMDVKLRVFCTNNGTTTGPAVYLADNNWAESGAGGITWQHQPELLSGQMDQRSPIVSGAWIDFDVSSVVTSDGTYTFALISTSNDDVTFSAREGPAAPQLTVLLSP